VFVRLGCNNSYKGSFCVVLMADGKLDGRLVSSVIGDGNIVIRGTRCGFTLDGDGRVDRGVYSWEVKRSGTAKRYLSGHVVNSLAPSKVCTLGEARRHLTRVSERLLDGGDYSIVAERCEG